MALAGMASEGEDRVVLEEQELVLAEAPAGARGGEVTYHGPGQLVAYPIVALAAPVAESARPGSSTLGVRRFVEALEAAMADTCAAAGVIAAPRAGHPGCWVDADGPLPRKIGALGIRVARGVTFHGIALNVTTDLADFDLIDPCGMPGLRSTSLARERQRARFPGERGRAEAGHPARVDQVEVGQVRGDVEGDPVEGDAPRHADPEGADLAGKGSVGVDPAT